MSQPRIDKELLERRYRLRQITASLHGLSRLRFLLRTIGLLALLLTMVNLLLLVIGVVDRIGVTKSSGYSYSSQRNGDTIMLFVACAVFLVVVLALTYGEQLRRRADAIYYTIADELQWFVGRTPPEDLSDDDAEDLIVQERALVDVRIELRTTLGGFDLPLAPGKFGSTIYFVINAGTLTSIVWSFISFYSSS